MTPWQESARMAGYIVGLRGGDKRASRQYYTLPTNSFGESDTAGMEFDRGYEDGQAIRAARSGFVPDPWPSSPQWTPDPFPKFPRAMVARDIDGPGSPDFRWLQEAEQRKLRSDAFYFLQYVLATGKLKIGIPAYMADFVREHEKGWPENLRGRGFPSGAEVARAGARKIGKARELGMGYGATDLLWAARNLLDLMEPPRSRRATAAWERLQAAVAAYDPPGDKSGLTSNPSGSPGS